MSKLSNDQKWELWDKFAKERRLASKIGYLDRQLKLPGIREDKPILFHSFWQVTIILGVFWGVTSGILITLLFAISGDRMQGSWIVQLAAFIVGSLFFGGWCAGNVVRNRRKLNLSTWESFGSEDI